MKVNKNVEAIIVTLLYLTCLYFWTLPIQDNPLPYGEVDAFSHYAVADYTYTSDRSVTDLPHYIDRRYGKDNEFKQHTLWYPPPFHTGLAIGAAIGGESDFPIYLVNAIFCSLIVLSVYFIIRRFFGFEAALLSGFLLIFSMRDIMVFLWGQWPERMGFAYLPLIIYCFYKYATSFLKKEQKPVYLYIMSFLLAINFFIHPMDFFHSVGALIIIGLFFFIKERKIFFSLKHVSAAIVLFLLIVSIFPTQSMNVFVKLRSGTAEESAKGDFGRLLGWFKAPRENTGTPPVYFSYSAMIGPYWTVPLILLGVLFLLLRRNNKDLVILGWLVSLYIMIHLDFIGKGRVHRSLSGTAHIFYPLMVLGLLYAYTFFVKLVPALRRYKSLIRYVLVVAFMIVVFISIGAGARDSLEGAYKSIIARANPSQHALSTWLRGSEVPDDADMFHMGALSLAKTRSIYMMGHRYMGTSAGGSLDEKNFTYIVMDYSDLLLIGNRDGLNQLQSFEMSLANNTLLYNKDNIRVYEYG